MHFYTNKKSVPKIGNGKIVIDNLTGEYKATLCFMVGELGENNFVDVSLTSEQLDSLKEQIEHYQSFTAEYSPQNIKD